MEKEPVAGSGGAASDAASEPLSCPHQVCRTFRLADCQKTLQ